MADGVRGLDQLIGHCPAIAAIRERIGRLLARNTDARRLPPVLILGETGTGKGLLARAIHSAGPRADRQFVDVNCAAIPETLLEAELFGYERGAFTDARQAKAGLFQTAHRGVLFLDEIGLLPEALQAKLLKTVEEQSVRRLGATRSEPVDVWILAATSEDLLAATRGHRFREDLYHRLAVLTVALPSLRERGRDVMFLAEHFLARASADYGLPPRTLSPDAAAALLTYPWPGNVRELANTMERVVLLSESPTVTAQMLALRDAQAAASVDESARADDAVKLDQVVGHVEREHLFEALRQSNWNITRAAARLGISRDKLRYRIARHGLRPDGPRRRVSPSRPGPKSRIPSASVIAPGAVPGFPAVRWEPRRLTLLGAALVVPPDANSGLSLSRALEVMVEKAHSFGGQVEELSPTGLIATFGLDPVEDAPRRAAHAAMAIRKAAERARSEAGLPLAVTLGIHVGQFLVGRSAGTSQIDLDGKRQAWAVLERLIAGTDPDSIVVSEAGVPFLDRRFDLVPMATPGGVSGRTYRLVGHERSGFRLGRRMARFVGRRHELELLHDRAVSAMRGHGQVVGIVGEAGIGKSRLLYEFRRSLTGPALTYLSGRCLPHRMGIPYFAVLEFLRQFCGITETDVPDTIADKVRVALETVGMDAEEGAPYLLALLGPSSGDRLGHLSPEAIRSRTFETLRQMALHGSRRRPIVFAGEDLHWIDKTSEECVASLVDSLAGAPILLVVTYRPGYRPPWLDRSFVTQLALQPLSAEDSLSVVHSVFRRGIGDTLAQVILTKAEGNPFFLEELSRAVDEQGEPAGTVTVPGTVEEVLRARIARLPEPAKHVLEAASVLGREFSVSLLRTISDAPDALEPALQELVRLEFLYEPRGEPEPAKAFAHALTQEVAYQGLPVARRQALHTAVGRALEAAYADRLETVYDRLAHHYAHSGIAEKAIDYLTRLAKAAGRGHAHAEAVRALEQALGHVERLPVGERERCRLDLIRREAYSLIPLGRLREILDLLLQHQDGFERLQDPWLLGDYYFLCCRTYLFLGDSERAAVSARLAIAEATRCGDEATLGKTYYLLAQQGPLSGQALEGIEHGRRAVELLERAGERWWIGRAYWAMGLNHAHGGEFGPALAAEGRARAIGEALGDRHLQSLASWTTGIILAFAGEGESGIEMCRRGLEHSPDPFNTAIAQGWLGYAYLEIGEPVQAIPLLEQSVEQLGQFRFPQFQGWFMAYLADAYSLNHRTELASNLASRALGITRASGFLYGVGCAKRALGRIALRQAKLDDAEATLREAANTFASVHARHEVARTQLDLAAAVAQARPEAAAWLLGEAHRVFEALPAPRQATRVRAAARESGLDLPAPQAAS